MHMVNKHMNDIYRVKFTNDHLEFESNNLLCFASLKTKL